MNVDAASLKLDGVDFVNGSSVDLSKTEHLPLHVMEKMKNGPLRHL